jgi:hypothetical protein
MMTGWFSTNPLFFLCGSEIQNGRHQAIYFTIGPYGNFVENRSLWDPMGICTKFRERNWEVQAGSPDKIFDKKMSICLTKL